MKYTLIDFGHEMSVIMRTAWSLHLETFVYRELLTVYNSIPFYKFCYDLYDLFTYDIWQFNKFTNVEKSFTICIFPEDLAIQLDLYFTQLQQ